MLVFDARHITENEIWSVRRRSLIIGDHGSQYSAKRIANGDSLVVMSR